MNDLIPLYDNRPKWVFTLLVLLLLAWAASSKADQACGIDKDKQADQSAELLFQQKLREEAELANLATPTPEAKELILKGVMLALHTDYLCWWNPVTGNTVHVQAWKWLTDWNHRVGLDIHTLTPNGRLWEVVHWDRNNFTPLEKAVRFQGFYTHDGRLVR